MLGQQLARLAIALCLGFVRFENFGDFSTRAFLAKTAAKRFSLDPVFVSGVHASDQRHLRTWPHEGGHQFRGQVSAQLWIDTHHTRPPAARRVGRKANDWNLFLFRPFDGRPDGLRISWRDSHGMHAAVQQLDHLFLFASAEQRYRQIDDLDTQPTHA
jgi:hypothetical protein